MNATILLCSVLALSAIAALLLTPQVIWWSRRLGLVDAPVPGRRIHTSEVPRLGGVAVFVAMLVGLSPLLIEPALAEAFVGHDPLFLPGILLGGGILFVAGMVDDLVGLTPTQKVLAQTLAAVVVFYCGFSIRNLAFGDAVGWQLGWAALPVTVLWIVGVTNAFNLIDGLDGLASGVALVALLTAGAAALLLGHMEVVVVAIALVGALLGFLSYNFSPARIFLGDSGSLFVGFMLAVLSVHGSMKSATAPVVVVPLFALALPIFDTLLTIVRRWLRGGAISKPDARHLHHRLLALGLNQRKAVVILYVVATVVAGIGLVVAFAPPQHLLVVTAAGGVLTLAIMLVGVRRLRYNEFFAAGQVLAEAPRRARRVIQDNIQASDLARVIQLARSLDEVQAVLANAAAEFGFLHMELCTGWTGPGTHAANGGPPRRAWQLLYPVSPAGEVVEPWYLRIRCDADLSARPLGAERVARLLAPDLEQWVARQTPEPHVPGALTPRVRRRTRRLNVGGAS